MKGFEGFEPTTGGSLSESQREIFKLLGLSEDAGPKETMEAYASMTRLYEDKNSPAFLRIKGAYDNLQNVREDLLPSQSFEIKVEPGQRMHDIPAFGKKSSDLSDHPEQKAA